MAVDRELELEVGAGKDEGVLDEVGVELDDQGLLIAANINGINDEPVAELFDVGRMGWRSRLLWWAGVTGGVALWLS